MLKIPVYMVLRGGLGNQLFMVASTVLQGKKLSRPVKFVTCWYRHSQQKFNFPENGPRSLDCNEFPKIGEILKKSHVVVQWLLYNLYKLSQKYNNQIISQFCLNLDIAKNKQISRNTFLVYGYALNSDLLNIHRSDVLKLLSLSNEVENSIKAEIDALRGYGQRIVAIHIRRGDRMTKRDLESVLSIKYFRKCLMLFNPESHNFIIFSDDMKWCRDNFKDGKIYFYDQTNPVTTLKAMSYCDDFILSPSTFSWWAAWLSESVEKKVVVPKPYFQRDSETWDLLRQQDWIEIVADWE